MSYDNPNRVMYTTEIDADVSGVAETTFRGPNNKRGRIYDYGATNITTVTASDHGVSVGLEGGASNLYGGVITCDAATSVGTASLRSQYSYTTAANRLIIDNAVNAGTTGTATVGLGVIPANTAFTVEVDGNGTGVCRNFVIVDWED